MKLRYAVMEFMHQQDNIGEWLETIDQGLHYDSIQDAEAFRSARLRNDPSLEPQNMQVIQYAVEA